MRVFMLLTGANIVVILLLTGASVTSVLQVRILRVLRAFQVRIIRANNTCKCEYYECLLFTGVNVMSVSAVHR